MKFLYHDILLDDKAFDTASAEMKQLKTDTENLKIKMQKMYEDLQNAMDTPAGDAVELVSSKVLLEPIDNLLLVVDHISSTLAQIISTEYYKKVFDKFEELNSSIKFN